MGFTTPFKVLGDKSAVFGTVYFKPKITTTIITIGIKATLILPTAPIPREDIKNTKIAVVICNNTMFFTFENICEYTFSSAENIHPAITIFATDINVPNTLLAISLKEKLIIKNILSVKHRQVKYSPDKDKSSQKNTCISFPVIKPAPITPPTIVNADTNALKKSLIIVQLMIRLNF